MLDTRYNDAAAISGAFSGEEIVRSQHMRILGSNRETRVVKDGFGLQRADELEGPRCNVWPFFSGRGVSRGSPCGSEMFCSIIKGWGGR